MTLIVPFDGSDLSQAALVRAAQFQEVLEEDVLAVSVIPRGNETYAREREWIGPDESFDAEAVVERLRESVADVHEAAEFHHIFVDRYAPRGEISNTLRNFARNHGASIVFVGSENAGRIVTGLTVGRSVAADTSYDTLIVSAVRPSNATKLEDVRPTDDPSE